MEERIEGLYLHGGSTAHVEVYAFRGLDLFQFVHNLRVIIAVFNAGGKDGSAVLGGSRRRHGLGEAVEAADLHDDVDKLLVRGIFYHELDRLRAEGRELFVEFILCHAGVLVRRQVRLVDAAKGDAHNGQGQGNEQAAYRDGQPAGMAHGPARELIPPGVLNSACRPRGAAHGPGIDLGAEHAKNGRQHGDRKERGQADCRNGPIGHGFQEGLGEEEEAGKRNGDHGRGENHSLTGCRGGGGHGLLGGAALIQLLAEARNHKEAIIDG